MKVAVVRKARFNAAHRLYNESWSEEKNNAVFGLCNNPNFHGHNYVLEVKVIGEVNPETGYVIDMKDLKALIQKEVLNAFDHKNLNLDVSDFKNLIPTAEHIAYVCYNRLRPHLDAENKLYIRLWETERNSVEYPVD